MDSLTDNVLMLRVKAGDLNRVGLLFERYHRELFSFLYHSSPDAETSEDMVQTVFYRMLKYRHTFTGIYQVTIENWVYGKINGGPEVMMKSMNGSIYVRKG